MLRVTEIACRRGRVRVQGVIPFQVQKDLKMILSKYPNQNLKRR